MPAIRPDRLKREAEELQGFIGDPAALRWRVVELLEFYANRTKRHGTTKRSADATVRFSVPIPVMQALKSSLTSATRHDPVGAHAIAKVLWTVEVQEARLLAIAVLGNSHPDDFIETIPVWVNLTRDSQVLQALANLAYTALDSYGTDALRGQIGKWLISRSDPILKLAICILKAAASDDQKDQVHLVFEILTSVGFRKGVISQPGYAALLKVLTEKNPAETTGYLLQGLKRGGSNLNRVVRDLLPLFPNGQRERLERNMHR